MIAITFPSKYGTEVVLTSKHKALTERPPRYGIIVSSNVSSKINEAGCFVVNVDGETTSELVDCEVIDAMRLKSAKAFLECEVVENKEAGADVLIIGRILRAVGQVEHQSLF